MRTFFEYINEAVEDELGNESVRKYEVALHPLTIDWRAHSDTIGDAVRSWYFDDEKDAFWFVENGVKQFAKQLGLEFSKVYIHNDGWTIASRNVRVSLDEAVEDDLRNEMPTDASSIDPDVDNATMRVRNIPVGTETHDSAGSCCTFDDRKAKQIGTVQEFHRVKSVTNEWWEGDSYYFHETWLEVIE